VLEVEDVGFAELRRIVARTAVLVGQLAESRKETDRKMAASRAETERAIAASRAETERAIKEARAETERHLREIRAEMAASTSEMKRDMAASRAETERAIKEARAETERVHRETERAIKESAERVDLAIERLTERINRLSDKVETTSENVGNVNNNLGKFTEIVVIPGIRREINAQGHDFKRSYANKKVWVRVGGNKRLEAEVDLFLTNGTEAMAVEIKTTLKSSDVTKHIRQLEKLRKYEVEAGVRGKELYGALAGVYVDTDARKLALKNGLYVLEIIEEEEKLKTAAPKLASVW